VTSAAMLPPTVARALTDYQRIMAALDRLGQGSLGSGERDGAEAS
jgi:hypothetical protein